MVSKLDDKKQRLGYLRPSHDQALQADESTPACDLLMRISGMWFRFRYSFFVLMIGRDLVYYKQFDYHARIN